MTTLGMRKNIPVLRKALRTFDWFSFRWIILVFCTTLAFWGGWLVGLYPPWEDKATSLDHFFKDFDNP